MCKEKVKRKLLISVIIMGILEIISITLMCIFLPRSSKLRDEERNYQYTNYGYYDYHISTDVVREEKIETYNTIGLVPFILVNLCGLLYFCDFYGGLRKNEHN